MSNENRWLLPEGIDELLPERAESVRSLAPQSARSLRDLGISVRGPSVGRIH